MFPQFFPFQVLHVFTNYFPCVKLCPFCLRCYASCLVCWGSLLAKLFIVLFCDRPSSIFWWDLSILFSFSSCFILKLFVMGMSEYLSDAQVRRTSDYDRLFSWKSGWNRQERTLCPIDRSTLSVTVRLFPPYLQSSRTAGRSYLALPGKKNQYWVLPAFQSPTQAIALQLPVANYITLSAAEICQRAVPQVKWSQTKNATPQIHCEFADWRDVEAISVIMTVG